MSKAESGGGEGVEILKNEPYQDDERQGQYTHKVSNIKSSSYRSLSRCLLNETEGYVSCWE